MKRGDVVLADFPYQDLAGSKIRPALVVQNDADNAALANTILAMITGNTADAARPSNLLVDPFSSAGSGSGLRGPSLVKCGNLAAVRQHRVVTIIGRLSDPLMNQINHCLKAALGMS